MNRQGFNPDRAVIEGIRVTDVPYYVYLLVDRASAGDTQGRGERFPSDRIEPPILSEAAPSGIEERRKAVRIQAVRAERGKRRIEFARLVADSDRRRSLT